MSEILYSCVVEPDNLALLQSAFTRGVGLLWLAGFSLIAFWHICDGLKRANLGRQK